MSHVVVRCSSSINKIYVNRRNSSKGGRMIVQQNRRWSKPIKDDPSPSEWGLKQCPWRRGWSPTTTNRNFSHPISIFKLCCVWWLKCMKYDNVNRTTHHQVRRKPPSTHTHTHRTIGRTHWQTWIFTKSVTLRLRASPDSSFAPFRIPRFPSPYGDSIHTLMAHSTSKSVSIPMHANKSKIYFKRKK